MGVDDHPTIKTLELVVQDDGVGAFVVVYRRGGQVESYPNTSLSVDRRYLLPNDDWRLGTEQDFPFIFEVQGNEVEVSFSLTLDDEDAVEVRLNFSNNAGGHSFLAAIGASLSDVRRFPLIYLRDGGFVPEANTDIRITIGGSRYDGTTVPVEVEGRDSYRTVYALAPLPFFWNEEVEDERLEPFQVSSTEVVEREGLTWHLVDNEGHAEVDHIVYEARDHQTTLTFSPPLPDLAALAPDQELSGRFCFGVDEYEPVVCGRYRVDSSDGVIFELIPKQCWQPMPEDPWVSTYSYRAVLEPNDSGAYRMSSVWTVQH